jgi:hypothetical protein
VYEQIDARFGGDPHAEEKTVNWLVGEALFAKGFLLQQRGDSRGALLAYSKGQMYLMVLEHSEAMRLLAKLLVKFGHYATARQTISEARRQPCKHWRSYFVGRRIRT